MRSFPCFVVVAALQLATFADQCPVSAQQPAVDAQVQAAENAVRVLEGAAWKDLFNGTDLTGWVGDVKGYKAENGVLVDRKSTRLNSSH